LGVIEEAKVELIRTEAITQFSNSGVTSRQLLFPENSRSARITITRVTVKPGAKNPPHRHTESEQVWVALRGNGQLLLEGGRVLPFAEGDVVRFEDGELHGFENTGSSEFEYLSVTSPPGNFRAAYEKKWSPLGEQ
jgi:quercetin dioxygenase-like cupin family protein